MKGGTNPWLNRLHLGMVCQILKSVAGLLPSESLFHGAPTTI